MSQLEKANDISNRVIKLDPHYFAIGDVSDVYHCKLTVQEGFAQQVAVKVMRGFISGDSARQRFKEELLVLINQWRKLSHQNVMECYGICQGMGYLPGLVLPLCQSTIGQYFNDHPEAPKLDLLVQVASAINYIHCNDLVHADIRGANILMQGDKPLLMDAGLLPLIKYNDFTVPGIYGRPRWVAPEILDPQDNLSFEDGDETTYTRESDVYAFGMTMLEVMTGEVPFSHRRNDMLVILDVIRGLRPSRPQKPAIPDNVWRIITSCWETRPRGRPSAALVESWLNAARLTEAPVA